MHSYGRDGFVTPIAVRSRIRISEGRIRWWKTLLFLMSLVLMTTFVHQQEAVMEVKETPAVAPATSTECS